MFVPEELVDEIKEASEIVSVISEHVKLKKKGGGYFGPCPFHKEKTASFSVSQRKQIFKCFGCGKAGNVFSFIMQIENVDFPEAASILADRVNIEIPNKEKHQKTASDISSLYALNKFATQIYMKGLRGNFAEKSITEGIKYLKERNFYNVNLIKKFNVGFAPNYPTKKFLYDSVKNKFTEHVLEMSGLFYMDTETDVFNNQIIFSVIDTRNRVLSLSGRYLDSEDVGMKYFNISKTPVYKKNNALWGLNITKGDIKLQGFAFVVEGQFDVMRLYEHGYKNSVSTMGTEVSITQAKLLSRYTNEAILIRDGDLGGVNSIKASSLRLMNQGVAVKVVMLPEGHDPNSFINEYSEKHVEQTIITDAIRFIKMWIENITNDSIGSPTKLDNKLRQIKDEISSKITEELFQSIIIQEFSKAFSIKTLNLMSNEKIVKNMTKEEQINKRIEGIRLKLKVLNSLDKESQELLEEHLELTKELQTL